MRISTNIHGFNDSKDRCIAAIDYNVNNGTFELTGRIYTHPEICAQGCILFCKHRGVSVYMDSIGTQFYYVSEEK